MNRGWNRVVPYLLILPNLLIFTVFVLLPVLWIIYLSFTDFTMLQSPEWAGLKNYTRLLEDRIFHKAVANTLWYWAGTVVPVIVAGLVLAALLTMKIKFVAFFRAMIYLPGVLSSVAVAMTWLWLLDFRKGPVNQLLSWFGVSPHNWLGSPGTALSSITAIGIWTGLGFAMLVLLAGIQGIPESLYEAAALDGASGLHTFAYITVPLLKPMLLFLFITMTIRSFQVFDHVYILTGGGPANASATIVSQTVSAGFQEYRMGYASAMAVFLLGITLTVTMLQFWLGNRHQTPE